MYFDPIWDSILEFHFSIPLINIILFWNVFFSKLIIDQPWYKGDLLSISESDEVIWIKRKNLSLRIRNHNMLSSNITTLISSNFSAKEKINKPTESFMSTKYMLSSELKYWGYTDIYIYTFSLIYNLILS